MVRSAGLSLLALTVALLAPLAAGWAQTEPAACTWENAEAISVRALERSQTALRGRCVRVYAETEGWALRAWQRRGIAGEETFIGAYFHDEALRTSLSEHPRRLEALGVVGHCSDICADDDEAAQGGMKSMQDDSEEEVMSVCMPVGFCHYYDDPYVMVSAVR